MNLRHISLIVFITVSVTDSYGQIPINMPEVEWYNFSSISGASITLPTNFEKYTSMRLASMGVGLVGIVDDRLTDYYRNPAFVSGIEKFSAFMDFGRGRTGKNIINFTSGNLNRRTVRVLPNSFTFASFLPTVLGKFGFSFNLNFSARDAVDSKLSTDFSRSGPRTRKFTTGRESETSESKYQISGANRLSENIRWGIDYTRGRREIESFSRLDDNREIFSDFLDLNDPPISLLILTALNDRKSQVTADIIRGGIILGSDKDWRLDIVGSAELTDVKFEAFLESHRDFESITYNLDATIYRERIDRDSSLAEYDGNAIGLEVNLLKSMSPSVKNRYFAKIERVSLDLDESAAQIDIDYTSTIYESFFSRRTLILNSAAEGSRAGMTAIGGELGWGMEVSGEQSTIGFGIVGSYSKGSWENDLSFTSEFTQNFEDSDTTYQNVRKFEDAEKLESEFSNISLLIPVGGEFYVTQSFALRLGGRISYDFIEVESRSDTGELFDRNENGTLSSFYRFGVGYTHSYRFRADMLMDGDLSNMSLWRLAIQYSF